MRYLWIGFPAPVVLQGVHKMKGVLVSLAFLCTFLLADRVLADILCFYKGERISGMNKICYYDCLGSAAAITVSAVELCPLNISR